MPWVSSRGIHRGIRMRTYTGRYTWDTHDVGLQCIRGGIRGIRRGRYTWRYTQMEVNLIYAGGDIRGIRLWEITILDINPIGTITQQC